MGLINKSNVVPGNIIEAQDLLNVIEALDGTNLSTSIRASGSFTGSLQGTASYAITASYALNGGGGLTTYGGSSPTTVTVGGLASGTDISAYTYDQLLGAILSPYAAPTFGTFTISGQSTSLEVGASVSGTRSFTWTFTNSSNVSPSTVDITDTTNSTTIATNISNTSPYSATLSAVTKTTATSNVWTISATNTQTNNFTKTFTVSWYWKNYFCASDYDLGADASVSQSIVDSGIVDSQLDSDKAWSPRCNSSNNNTSNYTYIVYPSSYGDLSNIIKDSSFPVLTAFTKRGPYTIKNANNISNSYYFYQSNAKGAFADGVVLSIT